MLISTVTVTVSPGTTVVDDMVLVPAITSSAIVGINVISRAETIITETTKRLRLPAILLLHFSSTLQ